MGSANPKIAALEAFWVRRRGCRPMPSQSDIDISKLERWHGNLALIDLNSVGDGTFRLCGTNLSSRFGVDVTGCRIASLSDELVETILSFIVRVRESRVPVHHHHVRMVHGTHTTFDELALPLSNSNDLIEAILFASYPRT